MSVNDASRITIDDSRLMLQIVTSLTDNSRCVIYNHNVFIVLATGLLLEDERNAELLIATL